MVSELLDVVDAIVALPALVDVEWDTSEPRDSLDSFRENPDGLRGGSAGADSVDAFRAGNGGGALGF